MKYYILKPAFIEIGGKVKFKMPQGVKVDCESNGFEMLSSVKEKHSFLLFKNRVKFNILGQTESSRVVLFNCFFTRYDIGVNQGVVLRGKFVKKY